jgi:hypothetical protein
MADHEHFSRIINLTIDPPTEEQRRRAALNVCATMGRRGHTREQIREVLEALDLLVRMPSQGRRDSGSG